MKPHHIIIIMVVASFYSCNKRSEKGHFDKRTTYEFDSVAGIYHVKNYTANGKLASVGSINNDSLKTGIWFYYSNDTLTVKEYFVVNGKEYINATWALDENRDTILSKSNIYNLLFEKDTVRLNEPLRFVFIKKIPEDSELIGYLSEGYENMVHSDFTNLSKIELDSFPSEKQDFNILGVPHKKINLWKWFKKSGEKEIRGFVVSKNSLGSKLDTTYFERKNLIVLDSVNIDINR